LKKGWLAIFLIITLWLSACSEDSTKVKEPKEKVEQEEVVQEDTSPVLEEETEEVVETESTATEQVAVRIGLGDTYDAFINEYGENDGDDFMARFQNDYILPIFLEGRAWNLKIQFESTTEPSRNLEEAKMVAQSFIPKDAQFVKEYTDELPRVVMEYTSESIAKLFPNQEPVGTFIVIFSHKEGNENDVFGVTLGVGNTP
jgi:hypothetical protein